MNRAPLPEMLHCTDVTVLERQRARLKWQQQQRQLQQQAPGQSHQEESCFGDFGSVFGFQGGLSEMVTQSTLSVKPDLDLVDNGWPDLVGFGPCGFGSNGSGFDMNYAICRTSSSPPAVAAAATADEGRESVASEKFSSVVGRESFKKRKVDKVVAEDETRNGRVKGCQEQGESKTTEKNNNRNSSSNNTNSNNSNKKNSNSSNKENSAETSKDNSKVTEVQKPDYIHVRARRGQATDSHSLAERVRREKISERMKYLQDLVPGCNKITGKAGMLDEIINYVQSLQRQVEFLSMKLAAVNPRLDFNIDNLFAKEAIPICATSFPTIGMSSDMTNPAYLQFNPVQQTMVTCGLETGVNPDMGLRRTINAVSVPETFLDSSCFTQIHPSSNWDAELQNLYNVAFDQGRIASFPSQPFTGKAELACLVNLHFVGGKFHEPIRKVK
ncbi:hypothetical protein K2173_002298 [Erythroxylum novogranatense]|uniref:BHLH domain-containing protein n=1 Tax=Erythroxylum novogranatense TaxID=1862640 RepID=A0AAV8TAX5_9ROSI|nr:hypothetical protein K2173_002298 [Erythroxylum novogranatense]